MMNNEYISKSLLGFLRRTIRRGVSTVRRGVRKLFKQSSKVYFKLYRQARKYQAEKRLMNLDLSTFYDGNDSERLARKNGKILFLAHMSLPYDTAGYSTRTHSILRNLSLKKIDVFTRLGYPFDLQASNKKFEIVHGQNSGRCIEVYHDSVCYKKIIDQNRGQNTLDRYTYIMAYSEALVELIKTNGYSIIHANSDYRNGIAAAIASAKTNTPLIYEVRGLWHITTASKQPEYRGCRDYMIREKMELSVCQSASSIIALTSGIKSWLVEKGIDSNKISVIPNGVDTSSFIDEPEERPLNEVVNIGYIGSFVGYEGLDLLVEAAKVLKGKGYKFKFTLVGDGESFKSIKKKVIDYNLNSDFEITGRVPFDQVNHYYEKIDICVYPRLPLEVCEIVSPLKPFEAMYKRKAVVVSDVAAQKEFIQDGYNGLLHRKGDVHSIVEKLELLLNSSELRQKLGVNARDWVMKNRRWPEMAKDIELIYNKYLEKQYD